MPPQSGSTAYITLNEEARQLLSGEFITRGMGEILAACGEELTGSTGILKEHFQKLQGSGPSLSPHTIAKKHKVTKFFDSGTVYRAITQSDFAAKAEGKLLRFGSSADIASVTGTKKVAFNSHGLSVRATYGGGMGEMTITFAGKLKHSAAFNKIRRESTTLNDLKWRLSISRTEALMRGRRARGEKGLRKFEAKGSLGISGGKHVLARGDDNLGYANLVQTGKFLGLRSGGKLFDPQRLGNMRARGIALKGAYKEERGKAYPLLPVLAGDDLRISRAVERALGVIFKTLERKAA